MEPALRSGDRQLKPGPSSGFEGTVKEADPGIRPVRLDEDDRSTN
jgi:hypothetical protein